MTRNEFENLQKTESGFYFSDNNPFCLIHDKVRMWPNEFEPTDRFCSFVSLYDGLIAGIRQLLSFTFHYHNENYLKGLLRLWCAPHNDEYIFIRCYDYVLDDFASSNVVWNGYSKASWHVLFASLLSFETFCVPSPSFYALLDDTLDDYCFNCSELYKIQ